MKKLIIIILLSALITSCSNGSYLIIGDDRFDVEIADTPESRMQGLMFREYLDKDKGMLFIFDDEAERSFWMKNTKIPLDIIFIDANKNIINILTAKPCTEEICDTYDSEQPAKYVLEINAREADKRGIKTGDYVKISINQ